MLEPPDLSLFQKRVLNANCAYVVSGGDGIHFQEDDYLFVTSKLNYFHHHLSLTQRIQSRVSKRSVFDRSKSTSANNISLPIMLPFAFR